MSTIAAFLNGEVAKRIFDGQRQNFICVNFLAVCACRRAQEKRLSVIAIRQRLSLSRLLPWFLFILCGSSVSAQHSTTALTAKNDALDAVLSPDGSYSLKFLEPGWTLEGKLPESVSSIRSSIGADKLGSYTALNATYRNGARTAEVLVYKRLPVVLLRDAWNSSGPNDAPFPSFRRLPDGLFRFSYQQRAFGKYEFGTLGPQGPSALFDKQGNVLVVSPADHFLVSHMGDLPDQSVDSRIVDTIRTLPAGFSHSTLIVFGKGMNETFASWGNALLALSGKQPPANQQSVILSKLGYWTDNGAYYYYRFEPQLGYAGTLLAIRDEFKKLGIPLGYLQLDSWWYPKGEDGRWDARGDTVPFGEYLYRADKTLFPDGLAAFQKTLGLPIVTHARWISSGSPYRHEFKLSNNVIVDPPFWKATANYLHDAGVVTYEQDWLDRNALPELNLEDPPAFLGNMSSFMQSSGIDIQYCMPLPAHYMASTLYPNLETIRTSSDRLTPQKWDEFLYDSRLASSMGLWPWTDVFFSAELPNLIISTLSAGPVGVGDALDAINAQNLMAVVRQDGFLIKPDSPLLPIDTMYTNDAANQRMPMVAAAETKFSDSFVRYVFSYPRHATDTEFSVALAELGFSGPVYAYDWRAHTGNVVPKGGTLSARFDDGFAYLILVPVNRQGLALLGDREKIVSLGKQRIPALTDHGTVTATIQFAQGEQLCTISGYSARAPKIKVLKGELKNVAYDSETKIFQAQVAPANSHDAVLRISAH
jgi:hypothetical protein